MKTWSHWKIATVVLLGAGIGITLWLMEQYQYKTLDSFSCDKRKELVIPRVNLLPQDMLELYVGGWIERGQVMISGLPSRERETLKFSRGSSVSTVSHAYIGEWYEPEINILFDPSQDSSCFIKVIYRHQ